MSVAANAYKEIASQSARDKLIVDNLGLVRHVIGKLVVRLPSGVDLENLESAGTLGLVEAAAKYDAERGVDFRTFAYPRVRGAILDELRRNCPVPQQMLQKITQIRKATEHLQEPPTPEVLARHTGMSIEEVHQCLEAIRLTQVESWTADSFNISDLSDKHDTQPTQHAERAESVRILADALEALPTRERVVVTLYYHEDLRLKEIGKVLKLSESRVSRLLSAAQFQLGHYMQTKGISSL